jgi:2-iminobutanoate/2-iminopropanoate deaminase
MAREVVRTERAPAAVGPYSQAIHTGGLIFTAGQVPLDPENGQLVTGSIEVQTHRVLKNLSAILEAAGSSLDRAVKLTVFMTDLGGFSAMNEVYASYFPTEPPARSAVQVAALPLGADIEMECVALAAEPGD